MTIRNETTIHERRAPTDESIKILKEYQDMAIKWAASAVAIKIEPINATVVAFEKCPWSMEWLLCYEINGVRHTAQIPVPFTVDRIPQYLAEHIAGHLVTQLICKNPSLIGIR